MTAAPSLPVLPVGTDTGRSDTDGITAINTPTLSGTAVANTAITLFDSDGTTVLGTGTANANGTWSIALVGALDDGTHKITAVATAPGGTASAHSPPLTLTVDATKPDASSPGYGRRPDRVRDGGRYGIGRRRITGDHADGDR